MLNDVNNQRKNLSPSLSMNYRTRYAHFQKYTRNWLETSDLRIAHPFVIDFYSQEKSWLVQRIFRMSKLFEFFLIIILLY